jgi:integrase
MSVSIYLQKGAGIMQYTGSTGKESSKWYYVIELGKDSNGKRKQKKKRGFKTQKEAKVALNKGLHELNSGTYIEPSTQKTGEYLTEWLKDKKGAVVDSTYNTYYYNLTNHILPELENITLANLKPMHIQRLYSKLLHEKNLSHNTVRKVHMILVNALERAVKFEMVLKNAAKLVEPPKETKSKMDVWDVDEALLFLETAKNSHLFLVYMIGIHTGMRQGEILGLSWDAVNLDQGVISVKQTLSNGGKTLKPTTKTLAGMRTIAIPYELIEELKRLKHEQNKKKLQVGADYFNFNLVNATELGTPINPSNLRRNFNIFIKKSGVKRIRFHDLRHTHATMLLKGGINPKIVSERLGHADMRMTLDRYSHVLPNMQKATAQKFSEILYGNKPPLGDQKSS